jgi:hypothetical protein
MSWHLSGRYVETCSCDLICPCNASLDHGATYDFCRVTLVFDIQEGEIDGTDIGGLKVPPRRFAAHGCRGEAVADQRVRDRVRGQDRPLDGRLLVGRVSGCRLDGERTAPRG